MKEIRKAKRKIRILTENVRTQKLLIQNVIKAEKQRERRSNKHSEKKSNFQNKAKALLEDDIMGNFNDDMAEVPGYGGSCGSRDFRAPTLPVVGGRPLSNPSDVPSVPGVNPNNEHRELERLQRLALQGQQELNAELRVFGSDSVIED